MRNIPLNLQDCLDTFIPPTEPKDYQLSAISEIANGIITGKDVALSLPTGTGKTFVYLPIVSGVVNMDRRVCVMVGTNYLIDQLVSRYTNRFDTKYAPYVVKGIEHYDCPLTGKKADYYHCTPDRRISCESNSLECPVLRNIREMEEHNYIITNFHKFLSTSTENGFNLIVIDDSHGFENALQDYFQTRISYYQINMMFRKYDGTDEIIADYLGEFLDLFDTAFYAIPEGTVHRRLSNDITSGIANIDQFDELEEKLEGLPPRDRNIINDLIYFVKCCKNATINTFYIQKDYYRQDDPTEASLIARKSDTYQRRRLNSLFKTARIVFASATMGDILTHAHNCTNRSYRNGEINIVPTVQDPVIEYWFEGLDIYEVTAIANDIQTKANYVTILLNEVQGKALLLFKSYRDQTAARNILRRNVKRDITFIDENQKNEEIQELVEAADIIMASASSRIWEGIDISNLKFEIIFSLPFIRPPVFLEVTRSFPYVRRKMLIRLQQGIGRIIRSETDQGICVILDPRLKGYKRSAHFSQAYFERIQEVTIQELMDRVGGNSS